MGPAGGATGRGVCLRRTEYSPPVLGALQLQAPAPLIQSVGVPRRTRLWRTRLPFRHLPLQISVVGLLCASQPCEELEWKDTHTHQLPPPRTFHRGLTELCDDKGGGPSGDWQLLAILWKQALAE